MFKIQNDMYKAGLICGLVVLYAFSAYSYFDQSRGVESRDLAAVPSSDQRMNKILETVRAHEDNVTAYHTLRASEVIVPGSTCVITSENMKLDGDFTEVPAECFLVGSAQVKE